MKVGIVGPASIVNKVIQVSKNSFSQIEPINLSYNVYLEAPMIVEYQQPYLDALLFAGPTPYSFVRDSIEPVIPWDYLPRSGASLLRALMEAVTINKANIFNVSFDSYDERTLYEAYEEIGISKDNLNFYVAERKLTDPNYIQYLCAFHKRHFYRGEVSCCVTALTKVHEELRNNNISCVMIDSPASVIRDSLHNLYLKYMVQVSQQNQIVALSIKIDAPDEHSLVNDNEYHYIVNKMNIAKQIYLFAQRIQAAVIEVDLREYLLFSTKQIVESETNNLRNMDLLDFVQENTSGTISLGIGYGRTANEAKRNSNTAMMRASKMGGNMAFIAYNDKEIIGPIENGELKPKKQQIDERFLGISEKVGISINSVFRLYTIIEQRNQKSFTTKELAELLGVTPRTTNRIIEKLELSGFCSIIGKKTMSAAGRPSRIIRLNLK